MRRIIDKRAGLGAVAGDAQDGVQAGLVEGQVFRLPGGDALGIAIDDGDVEVGVLEGHHGRRGATCTPFVSRVPDIRGYIISQGHTYPHIQRPRSRYS